jgi:hypothetical protein
MALRAWIALAALALAALALAAAGCGGRRGQSLDRSAYRNLEQGTLFAWAWGGATGFVDDDPHEVVVLFDREPADSEHRLASCDPKERACKSLNDFVDTGASPELDETSLFGRFYTDAFKQDRLFLVVAKRGTALATSDVITAAAASRPTGYSRNEIRFDRRAEELSWPRLADNELFVVEIVDRRDERPLTAIATRRKSWVYPEMQGLVQYFHDPSGVVDLRPGREYTVVLYAVNKQGWTTRITDAVIKP